MKKLVILLAVCSVFFSAKLLYAEQVKIVIEAISPIGKVVVLRHKKNLNLIKVGTTLEVGDEIITDAQSAVDIRYPDDSIIRLGFNTHFIIQALEKNNNLWIAIHDFIKGNIRALIRKIDNQDGVVRFRLKTATGTIGVRGTEFIAQYNPNKKKTILYTLEGKVLLGQAGIDFSNPKQYVVITESFESSIDAKRKISKPVKFNRGKLLNDLHQSKTGAFSALADRKHGMKIPMLAASKMQIIEKPIPSEQKMEEQSKAKKIIDKNFDMELLKEISNASRESLAGDNQTRIRIDDITAKKLTALIKEGANANTYTSDGSSLLMIAALGGLSVTTQTLINHRANINETNEHRDSAITLAAGTCQFETINILLAAKANVKQKNKAGETACTIAKKNACEKEVLQLLNCK